MNHLSAHLVAFAEVADLDEGGGHGERGKSRKKEKEKEKKKRKRQVANLPYIRRRGG
jgi:hypothetical protein